MATNDNELIAEVRLLTEYDESIIDKRDMGALIRLTKREIEAETDSPGMDFYSDLSAERALFWLACIFARVKTGEIEAPEFSIGELELQRDAMSYQSSLWFANFQKHLRTSDSGATVVHKKLTRSDRDRTYEFES